MFKITTIITSIILGTLGIAKAQSKEINLERFNEERLHQNRSGMKILGSWAAANILGSGIGMSRTEGNTKYFHQMNLAWNGVNLIIAGFGYAGSRKDPGAFTLKETFRESRNFENVLLFNAGLDVGYMAAGAYLWERGMRKENSRLEGYGQSLILQGGFLFTFDLIMFAASRKQSNKLLDVLDGLSLQPGGISYRKTF